MITGESSQTGYPNIRMLEFERQHAWNTKSVCSFMREIIEKMIGRKYL